MHTIQFIIQILPEYYINVTFSIDLTKQASNNNNKKIQGFISKFKPPSNDFNHIP